ncbi:MAG: TOBE domain-containing protein [Thiovulaceae bacterium]|nr:TOBE domain-containing protein [Sulfurimonadaceae bacterium]
MNKVIATVQNIEETDIVTYIHVNSGESAMYLIKSEKPKWLSVGDKVYCNFQEGSVCLSKDCPGKVSIENTLPVTLQNVRRNNSLCELTLNNSDFGDIISLITANAYDKLDLQEGCKATMLLRGIDIKLEPLLENLKVSSF